MDVPSRGRGRGVQLADARRHEPIVSPFTRALRVLSYFKKV